MLNPLSFISRIFKSSNDIELVKFRKILEKINSLENDVAKIKDSDFPNKTNELKNLIKIGKTLDEFGVGGIGRTFQSIAITATCIISFGALILYSFGFVDNQNKSERLRSSNLHSISAYNNAGFSLMSNSLQDYRTNY